MNCAPPRAKKHAWRAVLFFASKKQNPIIRIPLNELPRTNAKAIRQPNQIIRARRNIFIVTAPITSIALIRKRRLTAFRKRDVSHSLTNQS
jgi:hypothetical protein